jgi:hypothetical protein
MPTQVISICLFIIFILLLRKKIISYKSAEFDLFLLHHRFSDSIFTFISDTFSGVWAKSVYTKCLMVDRLMSQKKKCRIGKIFNSHRETTRSDFLEFIF